MRLKKLYRDQGVEVDGVDADRDAIGVEETLARIARDARRAAGPDSAVCSRPALMDLTEALCDQNLNEGNGGSERTTGPLYRDPSAMAHATKRAMNHDPTYLDGGDCVDTRPTAEFVDMLLFHGGIGLLKVGVSLQSKLGWLNPSEVDAAEFCELGPSETDRHG